MTAHWVYRSRQLFAALVGTVSNEDMLEARSVLEPRSYALFAELPEQYRRHALAVYKRVRAVGCNDTIVLQAALLHDCGKYDPVSGKYVTVVHRVLVVVLETLPGGNRLFRRLASLGKRSKGWVLHPFYLSRNHPRLGAVLAAGTGVDADVVRLIAQHQGRKSGDARLSVLQAADDES